MSIDYTGLAQFVLASVAADPGSPLNDSDCLGGAGWYMAKAQEGVS